MPFCGVSIIMQPLRLLVFPHVAQDKKSGKGKNGNCYRNDDLE